MILIPIAIVVLLGITYWRTSRAAYESAKYSVVQTDGNFEIRDYAPLVLAETPMTNGDDSRNGGFRRLFRFITGANVTQRKLSMTTPVLVDPGPLNPRMAFVLPPNLGMPDIPKPADQAVGLREVEPSRYAVLRFSGAISEKSQNEVYAGLMARMQTFGLWSAVRLLRSALDTVFWRRNEVLVRIAAGVNN